MPMAEPHPTAATHHNNAVPQLVAAASDQQTRSGSAQASGSRLSGEGPHPELPLAPDDDDASEAGVVVECEEGAIRYVKVLLPALVPPPCLYVYWGKTIAVACEREFGRQDCTTPKHDRFTQPRAHTHT
jgi:hypothetical protein